MGVGWSVPSCAGVVSVSRGTVFCICWWGGGGMGVIECVCVCLVVCERGGVVGARGCCKYNA